MCINRAKSSTLNVELFFSRRVHVPPLHKIRHFSFLHNANCLRQEREWICGESKMKSGVAFLNAN
jgi:hypothetical protein